MAGELVEINKNTSVQEIEKVENQLTMERQKMALEARLKDIKYTSELGDLIEIFLETLTEDPKTFKKVIKKIIEKGQMKELKDLMVALGIAIDKREALLGYDEHRQQKKGKMRLQVRWMGSAPGGVQIEET